MKPCTYAVLPGDREHWSILVGGKLGRHPQFGRKLEGIHSKEEILAIAERCLDVYFAHNMTGERLGAVLSRIGYEQVLKGAGLKEP